MPAPLKVLVVPSLLANRPSAYLTQLEAAGLEVLRSPLGRPYGEAELIEGLRGVFATVAGIEPYTERVLREAHDLEVIARFGVGYDQMDVPAATRQGVYVAMAFGGNHETVADLALALMGAVARNIVTYHQRVTAGGWGWEFRQGLWRATVGIVGLGRIGRAVARRCRAYEMRVLAHDAVPDPAYAQSHGIELTSLERLLAESDFVTLHAPHLPETDGLINAARLRLMKPTAYLINTARGGLVDEAALYEALAARRIAGAGLDVFRREPPAGSPLLTLDNVVLTPHAAGSDLASEAATGQCCVESILAVARGQAPPPAAAAESRGVGRGPHAPARLRRQLTWAASLRRAGLMPMRSVSPGRAARAGCIVSHRHESGPSQSGPGSRSQRSPARAGAPRRAGRPARDRAGDPRARSAHHRRGRGRRRRGGAPPGDLRGPAVKCRKCGGRAVLELRRHNTAFCASDFVDFFRHHVLETVRRWRMFTRDELVLVAVSGGKDSLALWDVLHDAGYRTAGLYIDLGIFDYSHASKARCEAFAGERGLDLHVVAVADEVGAPIPAVRDATRRPTCSACGLSKRYIMNRAAMAGGFPVVATGHNLDDEAATLFGSTLRWDESALARQIAGARGDARQARAPGEAALPDERARDRRLRVPPRHRLHRGGVPVLARRDVDHPQGAAESPRGHVAGLQGDVPPGLPRQGARALPGARDRHAPRVRPVRPDHDRRGVRLLQAP